MEEMWQRIGEDEKEQENLLFVVAFERGSESSLVNDKRIPLEEDQPEKAGLSFGAI